MDKGIGLIHDGALLVRPQCCTDFSDISSWRDPLQTDDDDDEGWQMLWIGHPWINWRREGDDVYLTNLCEDDPVAAVTPSWVLSIHRLEAAVLAAEAELAALT